MEGSVHVEVPRLPDRERLVEALSAHGHEARLVDDVVLEIPCGSDADAACTELLGQLEKLVGELDVPFVPVLGDGAVFLRPPAG